MPSTRLRTVKLKLDPAAVSSIQSTALSKIDDDGLAMTFIDETSWSLGVTYRSFEERQILGILGSSLQSVYEEAIQEPLPDRLQELVGKLDSSDRPGVDES